MRAVALLLSSLWLVTLGCQPDTTRPISKGGSGGSGGLEDVQTGWNQPRFMYDVPEKVFGGRGDVDHDWLTWMGGAVKGGLDHYTVWARNPAGTRKLLRAIPDDWMGAKVSISYPFVTWVEYREIGSTAGLWAIFVHDLNTEKNRVVAEWKQSKGANRQPIPLPYLSEDTLVWHHLDQTAAVRRYCIQSLDLRTSAIRPINCTEDLSEFPHYPRVNGSVVSYIVNTGKVKGSPSEISEPRSPSFPGLKELFSDDGELADWDLQTHAVEADETGVAWIAWGPSYGELGGTFYWEPGKDVVAMPERNLGSPPNELYLVGDAIVWGEPDTNVFAVRRELLACPSAIVRLPSDSFREKYGSLGGHAIELYGASKDEILVSLIRDNRETDYPLVHQTFASFDLPGLPSECQQG